MTNMPPVHDIHQPELALALQHALDNKTKPVGSLGRLEALAQRIGVEVRQGIEVHGACSGQ